jgi:hypothetical protein
MAAVFHTPIAVGAAGNATTVDTPLLQIDTALQVAHNADGTLKTDSVGSTQIAAAAVGAAEIAAAVAGVGLSGGAGTALAVNVDGTTIEINADALRVKDNGITAAKIPDGNITGPKLDQYGFAPVNIVFDVENQMKPGRNFGGKDRWYNPAGMSILRNDPLNPYGAGNTLVHLASTSQVGKKIWLSREGIKPGDKVVFQAVVNAPVGGIYLIGVRSYTAAGVGLSAAQTSGGIAPGGVATTITTPVHTVDATAGYVLVYSERVTGTDNLSIYRMWGAKGEYISIFPVGNNRHGDGELSVDNLVWDPFNRYLEPSIDVTPQGLYNNWFNPTAFQRVVTAANPYSGVGRPLQGRTWA